VSNQCGKAAQPQKIKNEATLLTYLSDPENDWPKRQEYSTLILKYKNPLMLWRYFSSDEIQEIERQAVENRKKRASRQRAVLYQVLYTEAQTGNVQAIKEFLDRTEGKTPDRQEQSGPGGGPIEHKWQIEVVEAEK
jgi:hypothetical protein